MWLQSQTTLHVYSKKGKILEERLMKSLESEEREEKFDKDDT